MESFYGRNYDVKSFAIANPFVIQMNKVGYKLGELLNSFTLFGGDSEKSYGVADLTCFQAFNNPSMTLLDEIAFYRCDEYNKSGTPVVLTEENKKMLFIDYLLSISMCYIEIPKYVTKDNVAQRTFDKFLVTSSPAVMAAWMGSDTESMRVKYGVRVQANQVDFVTREVRAVKLNSSSKGNSITVPRSAFKTDNMTCIPLFMSYAYMNGLVNYMKDGILKFTYLKDNNTIRELNTTLSLDILMDYYNDRGLVEHMLQSSDLFKSDSAGISVSSKQNRGYVRLPELGSSRYDATGTRSLNFARILKVEKVAEVDRTFIDVDLGSVIANFNDCIDWVVQKMPAEMSNIYKAVTGEDFNTTNAESAAVTISVKLKEFVNLRDTILSTTFRRSLHIFLVSNPTWFPYYTGKPNSTVVSSANFGVEAMVGWN